MNFLFAAGGTGGHIFPAVAVAEALLERNQRHQVMFLGTGRELERKLLSKFNYQAVDAFAVTGKGVRGIASVAMRSPRTISRIKAIYREFNPNVVVGFGGYPSFLPVVAALLSKIPTAIQEQNASLGLANKVLWPFVDAVFIGPEAAAPKSSKIIRVKNPVRKIFYGTSAFNSDKPLTLLIVGGSQGAMRLNTAVASLVPLWKRLGVTVVHQAGARDKERVESLYRQQTFSNVQVVDFIADIAKAYDAAHLVICRAGAMTVAEVEAAGRPAIFVPLPIARAHQAENVRGALHSGSALLVEEGDDFPAKLAAEAERLLTSTNNLAEMAERAVRARGETTERPAEFLATALERLGTKG